MKRILLLLLAVSFASGCEGLNQPEDDMLDPDRDLNPPDGSFVFVAPPTGDATTDVASITAAVAGAEAGDIIQFGRGIYVVDDGTQFEVTTPGVTLRGSGTGTSIRGVQGGGFPLIGIFWLNGASQSVQRLAFENFATALTLGGPGSTEGGHRVLDCTFRNGDLALGIVGFSDNVTQVERNRFINTAIPFFMFGKTLHFRHNRISVPDPSATPWDQPFNAGAIFPEVFSGGTLCENNVIEKNSVEDQADGFMILAFGDEVCRNNVIRHNSFRDQRIYNVVAPLFDSGTMTYLIGNVESTLIEENELRGSEGVGIMLEGGPTANLIVKNKIHDLPGDETPCCAPPGTGIFLDPWTSLNEVLWNKFTNVVEPIIDLGSNNNTPAVLAATTPQATVASLNAPREHRRPKVQHLIQRIGKTR